MGARPWLLHRGKCSEEGRRRCADERAAIIGLAKGHLRCHFTALAARFYALHEDDSLRFFALPEATGRGSLDTSGSI